MVSQMGVQKAPLSSRANKRATTLEHEWVEAVVRRDVAALDRILAEGFIATTPDGTVTKVQYLENLRSGELVLDSVTYDDATLRDYGDEAVVSGTATVKGRYKGRDIGGQYQYRYTEGYLKWEGRWQVINCQAYRVL